MVELSDKRKIALLVEAPDVEGGIQSAAHRHAKLMSDDYQVIPIAFQKSRFETDWAGTTTRISNLGQNAYLIRAGDLRSDHRWSDTSSTENIRQDMRFRSYADHLIDIIRAEGISLIHAFGAFHQRGVIAAYAAAKTGIPYMLSLRGVDLETRLFDAMLGPLQTSIGAAKSIICVSDDSRTTVQGVFNPAAPVHVIRNHFDPSIFTETDVDIPLLRNTDLPVIGCFGKFRRVMGLDFLLEAFERISAERDAILLLGGSIQKREVEFYNRKLETCAAAGNILRIGSVPHAQILSYLKHCTAVVYPSISDASPNKILEAMYARVPIVSTRAGGIPELVRDGAEALLVAPRSSSELADAITRILDDAALAQTLTNNAYSRVTTEHRIEDERDLWRDVYAQTLAAL